MSRSAGSVVVCPPLLKPKKPKPGPNLDFALIHSRLWRGDSFQEAELEFLAALLPRQIDQVEFVDDILSMLQDLKTEAHSIDTEAVTRSVIENFRSRASCCEGLTGS